MGRLKNHYYFDALDSSDAEIGAKFGDDFCIEEYVEFFGFSSIS